MQSRQLLRAAGRDAWAHEQFGRPLAPGTFTDRRGCFGSLSGSVEATVYGTIYRIGLIVLIMATLYWSP